MKMNSDEINTLHDLYAAVHRAHKAVPAVWNDHECNHVLTAIMGRKTFSWRVVGITPKALKQFSELNFRFKSNQGLTRAHLRSRIETVRLLLAPNEPLPTNEFIGTWLSNDLTVICSRGENVSAVPAYISIENDDGVLFSCAGKLAGWHHKTREIELLKELFQKHQTS